MPPLASASGGISVFLRAPHVGHSRCGIVRDCPSNHGYPAEAALFVLFQMCELPFIFVPNFWEMRPVCGRCPTLGACGHGEINHTYPKYLIISFSINTFPEMS